jgi:hypothetical protein
MQRTHNFTQVLVLLTLLTGCQVAGASSASGHQSVPSTAATQPGSQATARAAPADRGSLPPPPVAASGLQAPSGDVGLIVVEPDGIAYSCVLGSLAAAYLQTSPTSVEYTNWTPEGQIEATGTETCVGRQDVRETVQSPLKGLESLAPLVDKTVPNTYLCGEGVTALKASIDFVDSNFNSGRTTPVDVVYVK